jgi:exosome complex component CSL4
MSEQNSSKAPSNKAVLPGDSLGTEEEFEPGNGALNRGGVVVAARIGESRPDMSNRVMTVKPAKIIAKLPERGDYVIGTVESAASSIAQVKIEAINDELSTKEFSGMLSMRDERHRRSSPQIKPGDLIRAKVISTKNSIFHLSLDDPNCGVLFTVCSNCGGRVVALGRGAVKCTECGWTDDRMLSEDFVQYSRNQRT